MSCNLPGPVGVLLSGWLCGKLGLMQAEARKHRDSCMSHLLPRRGLELEHVVEKAWSIMQNVTNSPRLPCQPKEILEGRDHFQAWA